MSQFGRRVPSDWEHVEKHPLSALKLIPTGVPVVLGIDWYSEFSVPEYIDGVWWIGRNLRNLGYVEGGHAICARPYPKLDKEIWWEFYDQGNEGSCVGFSSSRMMTLFNGARYDAPWLYHEAQKIDEFSDTPPEEGTSVRAGFNVLRLQGHRKITSTYEGAPNLKNGISSYSWATSWDQVRHALGLPSGNDGVPLLNSWGRGYPHVVRITDEAGAYVLDRDGECGVPVDRP